MTIKPSSSKKFFVSYMDADGHHGTKGVWCENPGYAMRQVWVAMEGRKITGCRRNAMSYDEALCMFNEPFKAAHYHDPQPFNQEELF